MVSRYIEFRSVSCNKLLAKARQAISLSWHEGTCCSEAQYMNYVCFLYLQSVAQNTAKHTNPWIVIMAGRHAAEIFLRWT